MKKLSALTFLLILLLQSCAATVFPSEIKEGFEDVKINKTYSVFTEEGKQKIRILSVDEEKITGTNAEGENISLPKSEIKKIRKDHVGGTIALSGTSVLTLSAIIYAVSKIER